nr:probable helicase MAGATAMA 3 [Ipomoea batatas]
MPPPTPSYIWTPTPLSLATHDAATIVSTSTSLLSRSRGCFCEFDPPLLPSAEYAKSLASKQRVRVGCISPYKAQVYAIQEKLGKKYSTDEDSCSVLYSCGSLFDSPVPNGKAAMKPGP